MRSDLRFRTLGRSLAALGAAALMLASASAQASTFTLSPITIDTSSIAGTTGYVGFSFGSDTSGTTPLNGTVSVSSPSFTSFTLDNSGFVGQQVEPFTFGNTFTFTPTFTSTSTPGADENNIFNVFALDGTYNPYTTGDPTGSNSAVMIVQYTDGTVSAPTTYSPFNQVQPTPEASTFTLSSLVLLGVGVLLYRRRRQVAQ